MVNWGKYAKGRKNIEDHKVILCTFEFVNKLLANF